MELENEQPKKPFINPFINSGGELILQLELLNKCLEDFNLYLDSLDDIKIDKIEDGTTITIFCQEIEEPAAWFSESVISGTSGEYWFFKVWPELPKKLEELDEVLEAYFDRGDKILTFSLAPMYKNAKIIKQMSVENETNPLASSIGEMVFFRGKKFNITSGLTLETGLLQKALKDKFEEYCITQLNGQDHPKFMQEYSHNKMVQAHDALMLHAREAKEPLFYIDDVIFETVVDQLISEKG